MSRKTWSTIALVAALVLILGVSFVVGGIRTNPDERFAGTDSVGTSTIQESNPDYEPWFQPFFQPESGEVESGLFALQAAIGGTVLGFAIGALWGRRRGELKAVNEPTPDDATPSPEPAS